MATAITISTRNTSPSRPSTEKSIVETFGLHVASKIWIIAYHGWFEQNQMENRRGSRKRTVKRYWKRGSGLTRWTMFSKGGPCARDCPHPALHARRSPE